METKKTTYFAILNFICFIAVTIVFAAAWACGMYGLPDFDLLFKSKEELIQLSIDAQIEYNTLDAEYNSDLHRVCAKMREIDEALETDPSNRELIRKQILINQEFEEVCHGNHTRYHLQARIDRIQKKLSGM